MRIDRIRIYLFLLAAQLLGVPAAPPCLYAREPVEITQVSLSGDPAAIRIRLSGEAPYKIIRIDAGELMIAFQNAAFSEDVRRRGKGRPVIKGVSFESPHEEIATLIVSTLKTVTGVSSRWIAAGNTLVVTLKGAEPSAPDERGPTRVAEKAGKKRAVEKPAQRPVPGKRAVAPELAGVPEIPGAPDAPPKKAGRGDSGSVDDLLLEIAEDPCFRSGDLKKIGSLTGARKWEEAFALSDQYLEEGGSSSGGECVGVVSLLRAFLFDKKDRREDPSRYLETAEMLRDVHAFTPESKYTPYTLALLGKMLMKLGNKDEARGYYKVVLDRYKHYPGIPELLYAMGGLHNEAGESKPAMEALTRVVKEYPDSIFVTDARIALGKALFNKNRYIDALGILTDVMVSEPAKIYENPDLLLLVGNAYYTIGKTFEAREPLVKAYNFFPDIEARDVILTKVGDSYIDAGEKDKAVKIYRLVTEKFPGSDGFVISSMRLAEHLENPEEKESLYNMVITDYPDNPLAKLAMMRLAQLKHGEGAFEGSIDIIKTLLSARPGVLRKEALYLMRDSFEALFEKFLKADDYPEALSRFEAEKGLVENLENPEIFLLVGSAYLKGHIYDKARDMLQKAYDLYDKRKRPEELVYGFGVALHETGMGDEASRILEEYVKLFKGKERVPDALERMGRILMDQKEPEKAVDKFREAYRASSDKVEKARILFSEVSAENSLGRFDAVTGLLIKAIDHLSGSPEENFKDIFKGYRLLGENYFELEGFADAVDAFKMAVKFADRTRNNSDLYFRLAESYHRGKVLDKARESYEEVVKMEEPFWVKLAEERLKGMDLTEKLKET